MISCFLASFSFRKKVSGIQTLVGSVNVKYFNRPEKASNLEFAHLFYPKTQSWVLYHSYRRNISIFRRSIVNEMLLEHCTPANKKKFLFIKEYSFMTL